MFHEKLLEGPVAIEQVTGQRPHYSQFFRWTEKGLLTPSGERIRLEYVKAGRKRLTSIPAVERFFQAQTEAVLEKSSTEVNSPRPQGNLNLAPSHGHDPASIEDALSREGL